MALVAELKAYLGQKDEDNLKISSKYEWEILKPISLLYITQYTAKRKGSTKEYYCLFVEELDQGKNMPLFNECKKHDDVIVPFCDEVMINKVICLFFRIGEEIENPDEKKLLKMFIELNEINMASSRNLPGSKITIYYYTHEIILSNGKYRIYPTSVYGKMTHLNEFVLIRQMITTFKKFKLSLTDKLEEIYLESKSNEYGLSPEEHYKYLAEGNLNKKLRALI